VRKAFTGGDVCDVGHPDPVYFVAAKFLFTRSSAAHATPKTTDA
jgi:hypothetical protein